MASAGQASSGRGCARALAAAILGAVSAGGGLVAACSSGPQPFAEAPEAGRDVTTMEDAPVEQETGPARDAGRDALPLGDAEGNCSAVKGECDIVAQNCPDGPTGQKRECIVTASGGSYATECVDTRASQRLPAGHTCCPNAPGGDPCLPGLECIGNACVGDAAPTARCTPHCCFGSDGKCGQSDPEGFPGVCDLTITANAPDGSVGLYEVCSYSSRCVFFGVQPCPSGFTCILQDRFGAAKCYDIYTPDGSTTGLAEGEPCSSGNSCADGLACLGVGGNYRCRMYCLTPNSLPPFDAGALDGGPFRGGCSAGKTCSGVFSPDAAPGWLSICLGPDGG
jgi:hypothetical protein